MVILQWEGFNFAISLQYLRVILTLHRTRFREPASIHKIDPHFRFSRLVKPSGTLDRILQILLHYPTSTTIVPLFGTTFDRSNKCVALIIEKLGLKTGREVLISEAIHPRYQRSETIGRKEDIVS